MDFSALETVGAMRFFSDYGKMIYNPTGIFYWTGRSKTEAKINATIGSAKGKKSLVFDDGGDGKITLCIPSIQKYFPTLSTEEIFPYAPEVGLPAFREAWKQWMLKKAGAAAERLERQCISPMVMPGITGALSVCLRMFADPGDKIVTPDKRWENYDNMFFRNLFVEVEEFPSFEGQDFNLQGFLSAIQNVWAEKDRCVAVLNFPNNPTGYCPPKQAAREIVGAVHALCANTSKQLVLLLDDAYEGYVYDDDAEAGSLFYLFEPRPNFLPVKLDGISKELLWYGARVGAITLALPDEWGQKADRAAIVSQMENKFRGIVRNTVSNCSMVAQSAALKALQDLDAVMAERKKVIDELAARYQATKAELAKLSSGLLQADPFQGGFFCFVNLNPKSGLKADDVCDHLLKQYKVGAVPLVRDDINGIRLAFCGVETADIPEMIQSLELAVKDLAK
ncbi:MAG: aminotransferase class I/II-fold pyridoxal phosphate-dependent enzyme [bacterium]|nr:aminotransferase class I/II-fold pyridoxal phosphate-dependent enzyme [bacterium]